MEKDFIKRYKVVAKKYHLPDYDYIDSEFEIYSLEEEKYILRAIRDKIVRKIDDYVKILEDILYPDSSSYSSIYETRVLNDEDKDKILRLHQKLMILLRTALYTSVDNEDQDTAKFITEVCSQWDSFKPQLKDTADKLKKAWESETFESENINYLG